MTDQSLYEFEMETAEGRQGLAAAAAASRTGALLEQAFGRSGLSQDELAKILHITKGRVSQVLHGDGNLHVATAARFLNAMGYNLVMTAADDAGVALARPGKPRRRRVEAALAPASTVCRSNVRMTWIDTSGVQTTDVLLSHAHPDVLPALEAVERLASDPPILSWAWNRGVAEYQRAVNTAASAEESRARV